MNIQQKIQTLAEQYHNETVATRHHLHANPELSFHEYETSKFVQQKLGEMGIPFQNGVAGTGVVGLIKGNNPEKQTVALRADMDALPILEANDVPYKSKNEGVMHACGHDPPGRYAGQQFPPGCSCEQLQRSPDWPAGLRPGCESRRYRLPRTSGSDAAWAARQSPGECRG